MPRFHTVVGADGTAGPTSPGPTPPRANGFTGGLYQMSSFSSPSSTPFSPQGRVTARPPAMLNAFRASTGPFSPKSPAAAAATASVASKHTAKRVTYGGHQKKSLSEESTSAAGLRPQPSAHPAGAGAAAHRGSWAPTAEVLCQGAWWEVKEEAAEMRTGREVRFRDGSTAVVPKSTKADLLRPLGVGAAKAASAGAADGANAKGISKRSRRLEEESPRRSVAKQSRTAPPPVTPPTQAAAARTAARAADDNSSSREGKRGPAGRAAASSSSRVHATPPGGWPQSPQSPPETPKPRVGRPPSGSNSSSHAGRGGRGSGGGSSRGGRGGRGRGGRGRGGNYGGSSSDQSKARAVAHSVDGKEEAKEACEEDLEDNCDEPEGGYSGVVEYAGAERGGKRQETDQRKKDGGENRSSSGGSSKCDEAAINSEVADVEEDRGEDRDYSGGSDDGNAASHYPNHDHDQEAESLAAHLSVTEAVEAHATASGLSAEMLAGACELAVHPATTPPLSHRLLRALLPATGVLVPAAAVLDFMAFLPRRNTATTAAATARTSGAKVARTSGTAATPPALEAQKDAAAAAAAATDRQVDRVRAHALRWLACCTHASMLDSEAELALAGAAGTLFKFLEPPEGAPGTVPSSSSSSGARAFTAASSSIGQDEASAMAGVASTCVAAACLLGLTLQASSAPLYRARRLAAVRRAWLEHPGLSSSSSSAPNGSTSSFVSGSGSIGSSSSDNSHSGSTYGEVCAAAINGVLDRMAALGCNLLPELVGPEGSHADLNAGSTSTSSSSSSRRSGEGLRRVRQLDVAWVLLQQGSEASVLKRLLERAGKPPLQPKLLATSADSSNVLATAVGATGGLPVSSTSAPSSTLLAPPTTPAQTAAHHSLSWRARRFAPSEDGTYATLRLLANMAPSGLGASGALLSSSSSISSSTGAASPSATSTSSSAAAPAPHANKGRKRSLAATGELGDGTKGHSGAVPPPSPPRAATPAASSSSGGDVEAIPTITAPATFQAFDLAGAEQMLHALSATQRSPSSPTSEDSSSRRVGLAAAGRTGEAAGAPLEVGSSLNSSRSGSSTSAHRLLGSRAMQHLAFLAPDHPVWGSSTVGRLGLAAVLDDLYFGGNDDDDDDDDRGDKEGQEHGFGSDEEVWPPPSDVNEEFEKAAATSLVGDDDSDDEDADDADGEREEAARREAKRAVERAARLEVLVLRAGRRRAQQRACLQALGRLCEVAQQAPPEVEAFLLHRVLPTWDGGDHKVAAPQPDLPGNEADSSSSSSRSRRDATAASAPEALQRPQHHQHDDDGVLTLVQWVKPRPLAELEPLLLGPLGKLAGSVCCDNHLNHRGAASFQARVVGSLVAMLRRWVAVDWRRYFARRLRKSAPATAVPSSSSSTSSSSTSAAAASSSSSTTDAGSQNDHGCADPFRAIYDLARWLDKLLAVLLISGRDHVLLQLAACDFLDLLVQFNTTYRLPFVVPPSRGLTYRLLLAGNALTVSRVAGLLAQYKAAYELLKRRPTAIDSSSSSTTAAVASYPGAPPLSFESGLATISQFNSYIWDFSNTLWRNLPLPKPTPPPSSSTPGSPGVGPEAGSGSAAAAASSNDSGSTSDSSCSSLTSVSSSHSTSIGSGTNSSNSSSSSSSSAGSKGRPQAQSLLFGVFPEDMTRRLQGLPKGSLEYAYSLTHSVAFAGYASEFLQARGMPPGTSPRVIRGSLRVAFLAFLRAKGLEGMDDFLYTFISSLLERRQADLRRARHQQQLLEPSTPNPQGAQSSHHHLDGHGGNNSGEAHRGSGPNGGPQPRALSGAARQMRRGTGKVGADT